MAEHQPVYYDPGGAQLYVGLVASIVISFIWWSFTQRIARAARLYGEIVDWAYRHEETEGWVPLHVGEALPPDQELWFSIYWRNQSGVSASGTISLTASGPAGDIDIPAYENQGFLVAPGEDSRVGFGPWSPTESGAYLLWATLRMNGQEVDQALVSVSV